MDRGPFALSDFQSLQDRHFRLESPHSGLMLQLMTVDSLRETPTRPDPNGFRQPFSLLFCANTQDYIPQGLHTVIHTELGRFELFLVPVGRSEAGMLLEAVFN